MGTSTVLVLGSASATLLYYSDIHDWLDYWTTDAVDSSAVWEKVGIPGIEIRRVWDRIQWCCEDDRNRAEAGDSNALEQRERQATITLIRRRLGKLVSVLEILR
jgi:hypothetical protein